MQQAARYYRETKRATLVSMLLNAFLTVAKLIFGILGHSSALFADGLHSLVDIFSDLFVLIAARFAASHPDKEHPYGHGRIETIATVALGLIVSLVGLGLVIETIRLLFTPSHHTPSMLVLWVAGLSVAANEWLYRYIMRVANRIDSNLLRANAWHNRTDAAASLIVLVGVAAALMGFASFDSLASGLIGLLIIQVGWKLAWPSIKELIDTAADPEIVAAYKQVIRAVPGVKAVHQLRTRSSRGRVLLDVHVMVSPLLTVSEGHFIGECVARALHETQDSVIDVTVHIDPEDDEIVKPSIDLLPRAALWPRIEAACQQLPGGTNLTCQLHYLDGCLNIDLMVPVTTQTDLLALQTQYVAAVQALPGVGRVRVYFGLVDAAAAEDLKVIEASQRIS